MDGATTFLSSTPHFSTTTKDFLPQAYHSSHAAASTRKRKPIITYQSPGSGIVDVGLLVRNTTLEFEAAAARVVPPQPPPPPPAPPSVTNPMIVVRPGTPDHKVKAKPTTRLAAVHGPIIIPRPPHPLYHPLSRPSSSKPAAKANTATSNSVSQLISAAPESGRRSSSRTRRPAPKMRDSEGMTSVAKDVPEKQSPAKRRRGPGAGKRKRGGAQADVDGDGAYPVSKRTRKRVDVLEGENETMPPPSATMNPGSPPSGYLTRAKRPRKATTHTRGESSTSDGTGSATRTTPVNGHVEEFWVPTKTT